MRRVALLGVLAACGGDGDVLAVDAGPPDAAPIDAAQCSVTPAPTATRDPFTPEIVFDEQVGVDEAPLALEVLPDAIVVATQRAVHRLGLDGALLGTTETTTSGRAVTITAYAGGAAFALVPTLSLCIIDPGAPLDVEGCVPSPGGALVAEGAAFHVYSTARGLIRRTTFDATLQVVAESDRASPGAEARWVRAAARAGGVEHLIVEDLLAGATCTTLREHVIAADAHEATALLPPDTRLARFGELAMAAAGGQLSLVAPAACALDDCAVAPGATALLTTYDGATRTLDRVPVPTVRRLVSAAAVRDGDRTVLFESYADCAEETPGCVWCFQKLALTRLDADGTVDRFGVEIPVGGDGYGSYVAAAVIAPGDYVVASVDGNQTRVRRVRVP